jgi:hypothetical protein
VLDGTFAGVRQAAAVRSRLEPHVGAPPRDLVSFERAAGVVEARLEGERLTLLLGPEAELNPLLAAVAAMMPIRSVRTDAVSVHDIYVRAVKPRGSWSDDPRGAVREVARWEFRRFFKLRDQLLSLALTLAMAVAGYGVVR